MNILINELEKIDLYFYIFQTNEIKIVSIELLYL